MAWALLPRHTTSDAVAATGDRTHRLRRAAASMLPAGNERELEEALRHFVLLTLPPETELCRRGQPSECMYILLQGKLRVEAVVDEVRQRRPALACTPFSPCGVAHWSRSSAVPTRSRSSTSIVRRSRKGTGCMWMLWPRLP